MNVHIVTIAYGLATDLRTLFATASSQRHRVTWHLFRHAAYPDVDGACDDLVQWYSVIDYPYRVNRGVAKSWNEGILNAYAGGADVVIVSNDDIVLSPGDLDRLAEAAAEQRGHYVVTCHGYDKGNGKHGSMRFGFFAVNPLAIEVIGMFDENFFPMYWEDIDYQRRASLAGLTWGHVADTSLIHQGSKSIHTVPGLMAQHHRTFVANREYYERKWGNIQGAYDVPFNMPRFDLRIAPEDRGQPYPGHNRTDFNALVRM